MTNESKAWPDAFFDQIRIDDPAFQRPAQATMSTETLEATPTFTGSLLASRHNFEELISFPVFGIHVETYGSANQPWDNDVAKAVLEACTECKMELPWQNEWFAIQLRWFVVPGRRRDLDNFRLKPILDCITRAGAWSDDDVTHVRAIYNEAHLAGSLEEQRVEVTVYGLVR